MKNKINRMIATGIIFGMTIIMLGTMNISNAAKTYYQYVKTGINQFPSSYQQRLQALANKYPNWKFQAYYTGIPWQELIQKERGDESIHRNRVTATAPASWKHCGFVDDGWACASDAAVKYYLDPRNFLNETQIFQFVETSYNEKVQTLSAIQNSVKGTFLDKTITCKDFNNNMVTMSYSQMIIEAAKKTNISAFYIKSKIIQEVGTSGSGSVTGTYPGHEGYYNFYNYGAYDDGDDIANGLNYAKQKGWDSQYKAIIGGAELIGKYYINQGQNTAYFNKWDVVGTKILKDGQSQTVSENDMFWHQYMTNIQDPSSQAYSNKKLYQNSIQGEITFIIPVYENMPASNPMPQDFPVESIRMNQEKFIVNIDQRDAVSVTFNPSNASNKNLIWTSSNPDIVRVWNGEFRGLKAGKSVLTATTEDGGKTASCTVFVRDPNKNYVKNIKIEKDLYVIYEDEAVDVNFTFNPSDSANAEFEWTSSNPEVLRVWGNRFRGLKEGTAEIIARTEDGTVETRSKVMVRNPKKNYVKEIKIEKPQYIIGIDEAVDVNFTFDPANSANAEFEWISSNPDVLRVWDNRFRGLQEGTAEIIARTKDGTVETRSKVVIRDKNKIYVQSINVPKTQYAIVEDEAVDIAPVTCTPQNASNAELEWISSNPDILRVWGPRFRGLKQGTAYAIARTLDGTVEKRIKVIIRDPSKVYVQSINVPKTEYTILEDDAVDITPITYTPANACNAEIEWTSSNPDILRVWGPRFRGLKPGTAYAIARTVDGTVEKRIKVTIKKRTYVQSINVPKTNYIIQMDEAIDITPVTYTPADACNAEFEWTSSNPDILRVWGPRFRGLKEGTAYVSARTLDGTVERQIKVIIRDPSKVYVQSINVPKTEYTIEQDQAVDIVPVTCTPKNAYNTELEWTSSNPEVLRVWGPRFRGLKKGTAYAIARTLDGTVEKRIKVTIK